MAEKETEALPYSDVEECDRLSDNLKTRFRFIQSTAKDNLVTTASMMEICAEVFRLASITTTPSPEPDAFELRFKTIQQLSGNSIVLWKMITEDLDENGHLFNTAKQGAKIEKYESALAEEQSKQSDLKRQLKQTKQRLTQASKELKDLEEKRAQSKRKIRDFRYDLGYMRWTDSPGMKWQTEMEAGCSDEEMEVSYSDEEMEVGCSDEEIEAGCSDEDTVR